MKDDTRYVNLRTQNLIETINFGKGFVTISTVRPDGYGPKRRVRSTSFRSHYFDRNGRPYTTGYVPVSALPDTHPYVAKTTESGDMNPDAHLYDHLDDLPDDDLADLILRQQAIKSEAEGIIEKAKLVAKSRAASEGTRIYGSTAMVFSSGKKFDPKLARTALAPALYHQICLPKPDATLAKKILGEGTPEYKACQKDNGWTLTVREATDKDHESALLASVEYDGLEVFDDVPQF